MYVQPTEPSYHVAAPLSPYGIFPLFHQSSWRHILPDLQQRSTGRDLKGSATGQADVAWLQHGSDAPVACRTICVQNDGVVSRHLLESLGKTGQNAILEVLTWRVVPSGYQQRAQTRPCGTCVEVPKEQADVNDVEKVEDVEAE